MVCILAKEVNGVLSYLNGFALGISLAYNAKGCSRLCKELSRMPKAER